jgi:ABC-type lipoprotein export system ATPase subunit
MPLFLMENVKKTYRFDTKNIDVLKGIDLKIDRGQFAAIMGTSGSGKTTLMNLIGCLDVPSSGKYTFSNRDVLSLNDDELSILRNQHIGFVFQNFYLLPYINVFENVYLPSIYDSRNTDNRKKRAIDLLGLVGLEDRIKFKPSQLSGGQQQRAAIARALINDPELLLADEPTGQLDSKTSKEIMSILSDMHDKGKTVIVITHDANIANYADRIIRIQDGIVSE